MSVELDDGDLPVHLHVGVNEHGEGPTADHEAVRWVCWCAEGKHCKVCPPLPGPNIYRPKHAIIMEGIHAGGREYERMRTVNPHLPPTEFVTDFSVHYGLDAAVTMTLTLFVSPPPKEEQ